MLKINLIRSILNKAAYIPIFLTITIVFYGVFYYWAAHNNTVSLQLKIIVDDLNKIVSKDDVLATHDAGILGFFSHAKVTNLDGLANSFDYYKNHLKTGKFLEYFNQTGVTHLLIRDTLFQATQNNPSNGKFMLDDKVVLDQKFKLAEYKIPGQFNLILYKLNNRSNHMRTGT